MDDQEQPEKQKFTRRTVAQMDALVAELEAELAATKARLTHYERLEMQRNSTVTGIKMRHSL